MTPDLRRPANEPETVVTDMAVLCAQINALGSITISPYSDIFKHLHETVSVPVLAMNVSEPEVVT